MIENAKSLDGIRSILCKFKDHDLYALAGTVSLGFLKDKLETRAEAIDAIIKYSETEESFLKRKAITRDNLFKHLYENGVSVKLPITKDKLIDRVLEFWYDGERQIVPPDVNQRDNQSIQIITPNESIINTVVPGDGNSIQIQRSEIDVMAEQFTQWFYGMMNRDECMGTEHFFPDAALSLKLCNAGRESFERVDNNTDDLVKLLFGTKQQFNLFFNPNVTKDGVRGRMDPHGLAVIVACGTLHVGEAVSGVFEQIFALARDPSSDNNWKIKNTQLALRSSSNVSGTPRLSDSELPLVLEIAET